MSRHETQIDLANPNNSQSQIVELVGTDKAVLVVGCVRGDTVTALVDAGCKVSGVGSEDAAPPQTRSLLHEFVLADLGSTPLGEHFEPGSFDAVVLDTILHQHADPAGLVAGARTLLRSGGSLVVSVPNATHAAARLGLLNGSWSPPAAHPFTGSALCELLESAGLAVDVYRATLVDPLDPMVTSDPEPLRALPSGVVEWVRHQPDALCFQYIVRASPAEAGKESAERPPLEPLALPHQVRRTDEFTEQRRLQQRDDQALLVQRDHLLGLEARSATSAAKQRLAEDRVVRLQARARRLRLQLLDLTTAVDKMPRGRGQGRARKLADQVRPGSGDND